MLSETQRGLLDGLIVAMPDDVASAVRAALNEIDAARAAFPDVEVAQEGSVETCAAFELETYNYWCTYQWADKDPLGRTVASGTGTYELTRSTPILTFEDIHSVGDTIRAKRGHGGASLRSFTLMKG
jgi:hypothetical protein